jgi:hypothetical protein
MKKMQPRKEMKVKPVAPRAKKPPIRPVQNVKGMTREMLARIATWMETREAEQVVYATTVSMTSKEEWAVLEEAHALVVEYVRMGARL